MTNEQNVVAFSPGRPWQAVPPNDLGLSGFALRIGGQTICAVLGQPGLYEVHSVGPQGMTTSSVELDDLHETIARAEAGLLALGWPQEELQGEQA